MNTKDTFSKHVSELLDLIHNNSTESINAAAQVMVEAIKNDAIIHVVGAGVELHRRRGRGGCGDGEQM